MYIDFAVIDTEINDTALKDNLFPFLDHINNITVPYYLIKSLKNFIPKDKTTLSCWIDFPLGISDTKTRQCAIEQAHKAGATAVDIAMPQNLAANRKYDKIREDIKCSSEFCVANNIQIRYVLEYRIFDHTCLKKLCEIFEQYGISQIYPSSGYFLDSLADNILASIFLLQNSKDLHIVTTGNIWTDKHFETMAKSGLFGFRTTQINSLKNFILFKLNNKDQFLV